MSTSTTPLGNSGSRPRTANPKRTRHVTSPALPEELESERRAAIEAAEDFGGGNDTPPAETEVIWRKDFDNNNNNNNDTSCDDEVPGVPVAVDGGDCVPRTVAVTVPMERPHTRNPRLLELSGFSASGSDVAASFSGGGGNVVATVPVYDEAADDDDDADADAAAYTEQDDNLCAESPLVHMTREQQVMLSHLQDQQDLYQRQLQQQQDAHRVFLQQQRYGGGGAGGGGGGSRGGSPSSQVLWSTEPDVDPTTLVRPHTSNPWMERRKQQQNQNNQQQQNQDDEDLDADAGGPVMLSRGNSATRVSPPNTTVQSSGSGAFSTRYSASNSNVNNSNSNAEVLWSSSQVDNNAVLRRPSTSNPAKAAARGHDEDVLDGLMDDNSVLIGSNNNSPLAQHTHTQSPTSFAASAPLPVLAASPAGGGACSSSTAIFATPMQGTAAAAVSPAPAGGATGGGGGGGAINYEILYSEQTERVDRELETMSVIIDDQRVRIAQLEEERDSLRGLVEQLRAELQKGKNNTTTSPTTPAGETHAPLGRKSSLRRSSSVPSGDNNNNNNNNNNHHHVHFSAMVPAIVDAVSPSVTTAAAMADGASSPIFNSAQPRDGERPPTPPMPSASVATAVAAVRRGSHPRFDLTATEVLEPTESERLAIAEAAAIASPVFTAEKQEALGARPPTPPNAHHTVAPIGRNSEGRSSSSRNSPRDYRSASIVADVEFLHADARSPLPTMRPSIAELSPESPSMNVDNNNNNNDPSAAVSNAVRTFGTTPPPAGGGFASPVSFRPITPTPPASPVAPPGPGTKSAATVSSSSSSKQMMMVIDDEADVDIPEDTAPADDTTEERIIAENAYEHAHGHHFEDRVHGRPESADFRGREHPPHQDQLLHLRQQPPQRPASAMVTSPNKKPSSSSASTGFSPVPPSSQQQRGGGGGAERPLSAPIRRQLGTPGGPIGGGSSPDSFRMHLSPSSLHTMRTAALGAAVDDNYMRDEYYALAEAELGGYVPKAKFMQLHKRMLVDFGMPVESAQRQLERLLMGKQFSRAGTSVLTYDEFSILCLKFLAKW